MIDRYVLLRFRPCCYNAIDANADCLFISLPTQLSHNAPPHPAPVRPKFATQKPTIPHAFHFESDLRLNLRKQTIEKKTENGGLLVISGPGTTQRVIPDFRSVQAEQAAKRREAIAPTVPHSPNFVLEERIKERERFEEARREREAEAMREEEERRRVIEEEEERAWREARKMAVPKANAVPEWYAGAPKREAHS